MRIGIPYTRYSFFPPQEIPPELTEVMRSTSKKEFRILLTGLLREEKRQFIQKAPIIHRLSVISVTVLAVSALTGMAALACWMLGLDPLVQAIFTNEVAILIPAASFFCSFLLFRGYLESYSSFQKYLRAKKRFYLGLKQDMEPVIIQCVECGTTNRILPNFIGLQPVCRGCGTILAVGAPQTPTPGQARSLNPVLCMLLLVFVGAAGYGILVTPSLLRRDFTAIAQEEVDKTEEVRKECEQRLASRRVILEKELSVINPEALRRSALYVYKSELTSRKSYDNRFALSYRERALLHMQTIASDSTKSLHDALRAVAQAASPEGSDVNVRESSAGIALHIDFDMSSMTSGEHGTRTKHYTKESLRKEVISLISKVTNDIFQFCKDLHLASIHVGCRHVVRTTYQFGPPRDENTVLYKIRIRKNRLQELTNNPFLDVYSTTRHFEVEEDNFKNIEIITTKT